MAQFGKHMFGTSLFGKSNSFEGVYNTRIIDAGEPFDGAITVELEHELPSTVYAHNNKMMHYKKDFIKGAENTLLKVGSTVSTYVAGKNIRVVHGKGKAKITVKEEETEEERHYETTTSGEFELENFPSNNLGNYILTIEALEEFEFISIDVLTTEIQGLVRATSEERGRIKYSDLEKWPLETEQDKLVVNDTNWVDGHPLDFKLKNGKLKAETKAFKNVRYVQIKIILLSTDGDSSPIVNEIYLYSGDMDKFRKRGRWQTTLDMKNIAEEIGVTFKKVNDVKWIEKEEKGSQFDLHSSSKNGQTPSNMNIRDDSFWSDVTSKYTLKHNGVTHGEPYDRISLKERGNGQDSSATLGSVFFGPIDASSFGFTNTMTKRWHSYSGLNYYPRNSNSSNIYIEIYENKNDVENGIPPLNVVDNPEINKQHILSIDSKYDRVYARIMVNRQNGISSPAIDVFNLEAELEYESAKGLNNYEDILSPLNGHRKNNLFGKGKKMLQDIKNNSFDWPSFNQPIKENKERILNSIKKVTLDYKPAYLNQVYLGLDGIDNKEITYTTEYPEKYQVHSQVYAKEPSASVNEVDKDTLYWHYSYDGGTINFPIVTERELSTQFTPSLLKNKKYRYKVENGWSGETFIVPYTMTFEEVADITITDTEELKNINKEVPLYDNKILVGYEVNLPNNTLNEIISLEFKKTKDIVTDYSILNNKENDTINAWIDSSDSFKYLDWASDEHMYEGIINFNDKKMPYLRTQNSVYNVLQKGNHTVSKSTESAMEIATRYNIDLQDLLTLNNKKELFERNDVVIIPGGYSLPDIKEGLIFEGDHPYKIEIIPGSVRRTKGNIRLVNDVLVPGSDDEESISYTLTESNTETVYIKRGKVKNGQDRIPTSNIIKVESIKDKDAGNTYIEANSSMGDFIVKNGHIDWSPSFKNSKEPEGGKFYAVTLTRGVVDNLRIVYSSNYVERMSQDRMEAIPVIEDKEYQMDLSTDQIITLPKLVDMQKKYPRLKNLRYISENSDLWVNTEIKNNEIRITLNGEDPNINWYPTINTGFYYLNDKEHYLFSRPTETIFDDKEIPVIENIEYTSKGLRAPQD